MLWLCLYFSFLVFLFLAHSKEKKDAVTPHKSNFQDEMGLISKRKIHTTENIAWLLGCTSVKLPSGNVALKKTRYDQHQKLVLSSIFRLLYLPLWRNFITHVKFFRASVSLQMALHFFKFFVVSSYILFRLFWKFKKIGAFVSCHVDAINQSNLKGATQKTMGARNSVLFAALEVNGIPLPKLVVLMVVTHPFGYSQCLKYPFFLFWSLNMLLPTLGNLGRRLGASAWKPSIPGFSFVLNVFSAIVNTAESRHPASPSSALQWLSWHTNGPLSLLCSHLNKCYFWWLQTIGWYGKMDRISVLTIANSSCKGYCSN